MPKPQLKDKQNKLINNDDLRRIIDSIYNEGDYYDRDVLDEDFYVGESDKENQVLTIPTMEMLVLLESLVTDKKNPMQPVAQDFLTHAFDKERPALSSWVNNESLIQHVKNNFEMKESLQEDVSENILERITTDPLRNNPEKAYRYFSNIDWSLLSYEDYKYIRDAVIMHVRNMKEAKGDKDAQSWIPDDPMDRFFYDFSIKFEHRDKRIDDVTTYVNGDADEKDTNFKQIRRYMDEFRDMIRKGRQGYDLDKIKGTITSCQKCCDAYLKSHWFMRLTPQGHQKKEVVKRLQKELADQLGILEKAEIKVKENLKEKIDYLKNYDMRSYSSPDQAEYVEKWMEVTKELGIKGYEKYRDIEGVLANNGISETDYKNIREFACGTDKNLQEKLTYLKDYKNYINKDYLEKWEAVKEELGIEKNESYEQIDYKLRVYGIEESTFNNIKKLCTEEWQKDRETIEHIKTKGGSAAELCNALANLHFNPAIIEKNSGNSLERIDVNSMVDMKEIPSIKDLDEKMDKSQDKASIVNELLNNKDFQKQIFKEVLSEIKKTAKNKIRTGKLEFRKSSTKAKEAKSNNNEKSGNLHFEEIKPQKQI